ncbi:hypothetical protein [Streptomyces odontomachi]|uniref:hypothetical protein n=1 Tax=Streptomyces odontomachi TaxID=2944940 RepID=UPI00210D6E22|nr:hypothetical protein [Streptomyces sp. ODS25]
MLNSKVSGLSAPLAIGLVAGGCHAVLTGDAGGWPWLVVGLVIGVWAASGIRRLLTDVRERDRSASDGADDADAAAPGPAPRTLRRTVWCLGVVTLLWAALTTLLAVFLPGFARTGSGAFGVMTAVLSLAAFFTALAAVAIRQVLRGDLAAAPWGTVSALFLALWALGYVGDDWAGGSVVRATVGLAVVAVAGISGLVLGRVQNNVPGA